MNNSIDTSLMLIMMEWRAIGYNWVIVRYRFHSWYYLFRDNILVEESSSYQKLLKLGWYK